MRVRLTLLAIILIGAAAYSGTQYVHRTAADTAAVEPITTPPRSGAMNYGIAAGDLVSDSPSQLNQRLTTMESLGVGWVRFDFRWSAIQPKNASTYDWAATDRVVQAAIAHHLKILGTIDTTPAWASIANCNSIACQPANPVAFGTFSGVVAARYTPMGLHDWEVWNEENTAHFWQPRANPAAYTLTLKASYTSIKRADPLALVLTGGLANTPATQGDITPSDYLENLYSLGAQGSFDAVASHPYSFPALPNASDPEGPFALHQIMTANGDGSKPMWITEIGAPTGGPSGRYVSESSQASTITTATKLYNRTWIGPLFWYSDTDAGTSFATNENFFGLTHSNSNPKPAYTTLRKIIAGSH